MLKAYKYRLYPDKEQEVLLNKHFGASRFIYNLALECKQMAYLGSKMNLSLFDLQNQLPELKKEHTWLKEVNSQSLQASIINLDKAYTAFFKGAGYPKFKKKSGNNSFQCPQHVKVDFNTESINLPKFKNGIKTMFDRTFEGEVKTVTINKTSTGKYYASVLVNNEKSLPAKGEISDTNTIGIDLGLKSFITTSDGIFTENPRLLRNSLDRLKVLHRRVSKKKSGSSNRKKASHDLALLYERVTNQRKDFLHKLSTQLIRDNQAVCVEDLNIEGMKRGNLAMSVSDAGWAEFIRMLQYKADWYGKTVLQIGRFDPSSKMCSACGVNNRELTLADREWTCSKCGVHHDRDVNAAKNIKTFALLRNSRRDAPGELVESPTSGR